MNTSNSENEVKNTMVKVAPDLLKIIQSVGAIGDTFPIKNVVDLFGHYLYKKNLLNKLPDGSKYIDCTDPNLAKIFGVSQVNLNDLMLYLKHYIIFLPPRNLEPPGGDEVDGHPSTHTTRSFDQVDGLKRKHTESQENEEEEEEEKRKKLALVIPPKETLDLYIYKPEPYEPEPETPLLVQEYETDPECHPLYCDSDSDMSDSSAESWQEYRIDVESTDIYSIEYEVESLDGSKSGDSVISDTDSDMEEVIGTIIVCQDDSDKEFWADASSEDEDNNYYDVARPEKNLVKFSDKWECTKCNLLNSMSTRFCEKCWQKGPNLLWQLGSERHPPAWHRRRKMQLQSREGSQVEYSSQENSGLVLSQPDVGHLCSICLEWPKTGIIVHGRTSHQVCCFQCASKLWKRQLPCPVCRRRIQRVTRNFVA